MTAIAPVNYPEIAEKAARVLTQAAAADVMVATAESCTGGMLAAVLTAIEGESSVFDRGFVTYTRDAKRDLLGLDAAFIARHGEVSEETVRAMAKSALDRSKAGLVCAITGYTGKADRNGEDGLVYIAAMHRDRRLLLRECHFGERDRAEARRLSVEAALDMLIEALADLAVD
jgi:nicotinamide-nucleotide amidase